MMSLLLVDVVLGKQPGITGGNFKKRKFFSLGEVLKKKNPFLLFCFLIQNADKTESVILKVGTSLWTWDCIKFIDF